MEGRGGLASGPSLVTEAGPGEIVPNIFDFPPKPQGLLVFHARQSPRHFYPDRGATARKNTSHAAEHAWGSERPAPLTGSHLSPGPASPARRATCCFLSVPWPLVLIGLCMVVFSAGATVTFFAPLSSPSTCSYRGPFPDATLADRSTLSSELASHGVLQCTPEVSLLSQRPTQACSCPTLAVTVLQV